MIHSTPEQALQRCSGLALRQGRGYGSGNRTAKARRRKGLLRLRSGSATKNHEGVALGFGPVFGSFFGIGIGIAIALECCWQSAVETGWLLWNRDAVRGVGDGVLWLPRLDEAATGYRMEARCASSWEGLGGLIEQDWGEFEYEWEYEYENKGEGDILLLHAEFSGTTETANSRRQESSMRSIQSSFPLKICT